MNITQNVSSATAKKAESEFVRIFGIVCSERDIAAEFSLKPCDNEESFSVVCTEKKIFFSAGCPRALLYAVYDYFEKGYSVSYFWDGDVYPAEKRHFALLNYNEEPRFTYRGLRYFAHRGLYRFQAEEWGIDDWKRELDWMVKNKLNMFMLRLGNRNAFERAFPDTVLPDDGTGNLYEGQHGFSERSPIRSSEEDLKIERFINSYADELGLIRPVDCGTMTHWYSQTPQSFIDKYLPEFLSQSNTLYSDKRSLVWDIRNERELNLYFKLTDAYVSEYGEEGLFHTIGLAERLFSVDRGENLALKKYTYRRICEHLKEKYPQSKLLIASWDFSMFWKSEEVSELLDELDPKQCIIFDYTSDTQYNENNFTKWGVCNRFPYVFGIFHAYEPQNDIRGDYELIKDRMQNIADDKNCVGFVTWQELSHGDGFMLDFFARNAWKPDFMPHDVQIKAYCEKRFSSHKNEMTELYILLSKIAQFSHWCGDRLHAERNVFRDFSAGELTSEYEKPIFCKSLSEKRLAFFESELKRFSSHKADASKILRGIADLLKAFSGEGEFREAFDMAVTAASKYIHFEIIEAAIKLYSGDFSSAVEDWNRITELEKRYTRLLGANRDYSICAGIDLLKKQCAVNPYFIERTVKENIDNIYCRTNAYELMLAVTLPEFDTIGRWLARCSENKLLSHDNKLEEDMAAIHESFLSSDIYKYAPAQTNAADAMKDLAEIM